MEVPSVWDFNCHQWFKNSELKFFETLIAINETKTVNQSLIWRVSPCEQTKCYYDSKYY